MSTDSSSVFYRNLRKRYRTITSGEGVYLHDAEGRQYLDAVGGAGVVIIGHGVKAVTRALAESPASSTYVYGADFTTRWQEELASRVLALSGMTGGAAYFVSGGSEANETAIKLAREYHLQRGDTQRYKIISRWQSFHGVTMATLSVSGRTSWRSPYDPYLLRVTHIVPPYCYRCPFRLTYPSCGVACADDLERTILLEGPESVAAFIAEPIIGTTIPGVTPVPEYYARIRQICDRYQILFIADEVLTGYGRTGKSMAMQHWGVLPDVITLGKGIGSGYAALGAVVASDRVINAIRDGSGVFRHGFTYSGLPAACFVGLRVLDYVEENKLFAQVSQRGDYLHSLLSELAEAHPVIGQVRGRGLLAGIEFVAERRSKEILDPLQRYAARVVFAAQEHGVLLRSGVSGANYGNGGDHIQISPPYVIAEKELDRIVDVLDKVLTEVVPEI